MNRTAQSPRARWRFAVPVVALAAGLLFATSASTSGGTSLRSSGTDGLVGLVRAAQRTAQQQQAQAAALQGEITAQTDAAAQANHVAPARARGAADEQAAGLTGVVGSGVAVVLDDAHSAPPAGIDANQSVVHQSDLQAVVNAVWAGGAEAVSVAGQRLIATSAVRCVGNTLLLNGQVYSPPFRIEAIGPTQSMRTALQRSAAVALYRQAADVLGLTYEVRDVPTLRLPAYDGSIGPRSAKVTRR